MTELTFVTGNLDKYLLAKEIFGTAGLQLRQEELDIDEVQSESAEYIARIKAQTSFSMLQKPIIIRDDSWSLPGLKGFPGPYMKSINRWLSDEDFLRLTLPLQDRRAILTQTLIYQDSNSSKLFTLDTKAELLKEIRGDYGVPFERITSIEGDEGKSIAEVMSSGISHTNRAPAEIWHTFIEWYKKEKL